MLPITIHHNFLMICFPVVQILLRRKRMNPDAANLLTFGYKEPSPGLNGHRVLHSNDVVCFFPNTIVSRLKQHDWTHLHQLIGTHAAGGLHGFASPCHCILY